MSIELGSMVEVLDTHYDSYFHGCIGKVSHVRVNGLCTVEVSSFHLARMRGIELPSKDVMLRPKVHSRNLKAVVDSSEAAETSDE